MAFRLYDTYGLNLEVITKLAEIESLIFNPEDFHEEFKRIKLMSKLKSSKMQHDNFITEYSLNYLESKKIPKTDDSYKYIYTYKDNTYNFPIIDSTLLGVVVNGK